MHDSREQGSLPPYVLVHTKNTSDLQWNLGFSNLQGKRKSGVGDNEGKINSEANPKENVVGLIDLSGASRNPRVFEIIGIPL